ncbi:hypothetical protein FGL95_02760 [Nocardiaceae bacterium YC2-7]|uniref:NAD(P)H nitroreductase n=2 Tax=Antrihabitans stalactiti TaxID=2584121 RepID=A0A848K495_9NOCA|nr:hypothetical protein [Antrihabitans stalactiti]
MASAMTTVPKLDKRTIEAAVALACRAPSLHNSQPWRWVVDGNTLQLFADSDRLLPSTDAFGRQMVISCGAVLHHLSIAFAAAGWTTTIARIPDASNPGHLATVLVEPDHAISDDDVKSATAITRRSSDRLPLLAPPDPDVLATSLAALLAHTGTQIELIDRGQRSELIHASALAASLRGHDSMYQEELDWWAGESTLPEGVPTDSLVSADEQERVALGRKFPPGRPNSRRVDLADDRAAIFVLSTPADARLDWLRCGEALSAVLLECTIRGLATCALTHLTELPRSREMIGKVARNTGAPQVVIRVGVAPEPGAERLTPRRPLSEVLFTKRNI